MALFGPFLGPSGYPSWGGSRPPEADWGPPGGGVSGGASGGGAPDGGSGSGVWRPDTFPTLRSILIPELLKSKRAEIKVLRASEKRSAEKRTAKAKATQCPHKSEGAYFVTRPS